MCDLLFGSSPRSDSRSRLMGRRHAASPISARASADATSSLVGPRSPAEQQINPAA